MTLGILYVCATPIGNLGDVSTRLAQVLKSVVGVYAEDTRRARILLDALGIRIDVRSHFAGNEMRGSEEIVARLTAGEHLALLTDAGTPVVSDPGATAVSLALDAGVTVSVVPGPSAVTSALAVSGFPGDRFVFEGFLPRKGVERRTRLEELGAEGRTIVLFSAPHRLRVDLTDLTDHMGADRRICIARELTKLHEEISRSTLVEAIATWDAREPRGEYTLVVEGGEPPVVTMDEATGRARELVTMGETRSAAARMSARESGLDRRAIYDALLGDQAEI